MSGGEGIKIVEQDFKNDNFLSMFFVFLFNSKIDFRIKTFQKCKRSRNSVECKSIEWNSGVDVVQVCYFQFFFLPKNND